MTYWVLAYYIFTPLEDPELEVQRHKEFFEDRDVKCRIYIAKEGINGQMSAAIEDGEAYIAWMRADSRFKGIEFKIHTYPEHVFPRMSVKLKSQLVALDKKVDTKNTGEHLSPEAWAKMVEAKDEDTVIVDVRNDYEWKVGHFEGAALPQYETFREFPQYIEKLKKERDPKKTKIMMYCTGGIRCELYSVLMKEEGFEHVYQLDGGVIKYGLEQGTKHWKGKLFVFDDRLVVPINQEGTGETIARCRFCDALSDLYYNCANMDCNELFIACRECAQKSLGCCSGECEGAPRLRPFHDQESPKPYRRILKDGTACKNQSDQA